MLPYVVSYLPRNFVGITTNECIVPVNNARLLTEVNTTLCYLSSVWRLINDNNNDGLLTLLRSALRTNTCVTNVISQCPYNVLYNIISSNMTSQEIRNYATHLVDFAEHIYICTIIYTLYSYADSSVKSYIAERMVCDIQDIGKKPTLIEQINAIPLEHKLPWFEEAVHINNVVDITMLFDEYRFPYELAVIVLDTLIECADNDLRREALKNARLSLDTSDVLSLWSDNDVYSMQICINAVDRGIISIDDLHYNNDNAVQTLYRELAESKYLALPNGGLHKLTALIVGYGSPRLKVLEAALVSGFILDNCKFCAKIKCD